MTSGSIAVTPETTVNPGLQVLSNSDGYLVVEDVTGEATEVSNIAGTLTCGCFIATVSNYCEHIRTVVEHQTQANSPSTQPVMSQADADRFLSRIAKLDYIQSQNEESAEEQIERIRLWLEMESLKLDRQRAFYLMALENYMQVEGFSTKRLVNGTLKMRAQQPEIKINDEAVVLHDERFIRVVPEKRVVDKMALRKYVVSTGEEVEGTEVILHCPKFSYKLNSGGS